MMTVIIGLACVAGLNYIFFNDDIKYEKNKITHMNSYKYVNKNK